jgi:hypothetical protein
MNTRHGRVGRVFAILVGLVRSIIRIVDDSEADR